MKKNFLFLVAIMLVAFAFTSCSSVKHGVGKGLSNSEQVSNEIADLNAAIDASKQDNFTVSDNAKIISIDKDGRSTTVYESTKTGYTSAVFTDNTFNRKNTKHLGGKWRTVTKFTGGIVKKTEEED